MTRILLGFVFVSIIFMIFACGDDQKSESIPSTSNPTSQTASTAREVVGSVALDNPNMFAEPGESCEGFGSSRDVQPGAQVVVKDGSGRVLATGTLESGTRQGEGSGADLFCVFPFTVANVADAEFYSFEVNGRVAQTYSRAELEANSWQVTLSIQP